MKRPSLYYGWIILAVSFVTVVVVYGVRYSFPGAFYPAILDEFGWSRASTASIFSVNMFIYGFSALLAGALADKYGARKVLILGATVLAVGTALSSQGRAIWHFYLTFGVLTSFGMALVGYAPLVTMLSNWFVRRRGLALGFLNSVVALAYLYALLTQYFISKLGWPATFLVLAGLVAFIALPLVVIVPRHRPQDMGLLPTEPGVSEGAIEKTSTSRKRRTAPDQKWAVTEWTLAKALKTYRLWALFFAVFCTLGITTLLIATQQVKFLEDVGYSRMFGAFIFGLYGIAYTMGNLCGFISDFIGREMTMTAGSLGAILGVSLLFLIRDASHPWLPVLYAITFSFSLGLTVNAIIATAPDLFQGKHFGSIFGFTMLAFALGGAIGPWLGGRLYDTTGSYSIAFTLVIIVLGASLALLWIASPSKVRPVPGRFRLTSERPAGRLNP